MRPAKARHASGPLKNLLERTSFSYFDFTGAVHSLEPNGFDWRGGILILGTRYARDQRMQQPYSFGERCRAGLKYGAGFNIEDVAVSNCTDRFPAGTCSDRV